MASVVASLEVEIDADVKGLSSGLNTAESKIDGFSNQSSASLGKVTSALAGIGASIGVMAIGQEAINTAIEFESAWAGVEKTVDATDAELLALKDTIRDMATDSDNPLSALENSFVTLSTIAELGGQLGIAKDDIDEFVQTVGAMTMATNLSGEEAATFFAKFANVTGLPTDQFDELGDVIVTLGNNFAVTETDIAAWGTRLATLSMFDWSPEDILAYGAALGSMGLSPELGSTNLIKTVTDMTTAVSTGTPELEKYADAAGMTVDEFADLAKIDSERAFNAFIEGLSEMDIDDQLQTLKDLGVTSSEQQRTILSMAAGYEDVLTPAVDSSSDAMEGNNALMEEAGKRAETTEGKINTFSNNLDDLKAKLGEVFLPLVNDIVVALSDGISAWEDLLPNIVLGLEFMLDDVRRSFDRFFLDINQQFLDIVNNPLFQAFAPTLGIAMNMSGDAFDGLGDMIDQQRSGIAMADEFAETFLSQLRTQNIDLSEMITIDGVGTFSLEQLLDESGTIENMSARGKFMIEQGIQQAIAGADLSTAQTLLSAAIELDLDDAKIAEWQSQISSSFSGAATGPAVAPAVDVSPTLADSEGTKSMIIDAVEALEYSAALDNVQTTLTHVWENVQPFIDAVQAEVEAQQFAASVNMAITINPVIASSPSLQDLFNQAGLGGAGGSTPVGAGGSQSAPPVGAGQGPGLMGGSVTTINVSTGNVVSERGLLEIVEEAARKAGIK